MKLRQGWNPEARKFRHRRRVSFCWAFPFLRFFQKFRLFPFVLFIPLKFIFFIAYSLERKGVFCENPPQIIPQIYSYEPWFS